MEHADLCDLKQVMVAAFVVGIILLLLSLLSSQIGQTAVQANSIFQHWSFLLHDLYGFVVDLS